MRMVPSFWGLGAGLLLCTSPSWRVFSIISPVNPQSHKDPFVFYAVAMIASFVLPLIFFGVGKEWAAVRNWQGAALLLVVVTSARLRSLRPLSEGVVSRGLWPALLASVLVSFVATTLFRYWSFNVNAYDFSIFDLGLYATWFARLMQNPVCSCNHLAVHLTGNLILLAPLVALFKSHYFLLVTHAVIVWSGAFPLRRIARRHLGSERLAFLVVMAYLASSRVGSIVGYPFHFEVLFLPFGFWLIEGWETRRTWVWVAAALALATTKEEAPLYVLGFASAELLFGAKERRKAAAGLAFAAAVLFAAFSFWVLPSIRQATGFTPAYLSEWSRYGETMAQAVVGMLAAPHLVLIDLITSKWYLLFGATLLLPLFSPRAVVAMTPAMVILSTATAESMRGFGLYYSAPLLPFLFWGLVDAGRFPKLKAWIAAAAIVSPLVGAGYLRYLPVRGEAREGLREVVAAGEPGRRYCVQAAILPHLPYDWSVELLSKACAERRDTALIINGELNPYPLDSAALAALASARGSGKVRGFAGGFKVLDPPGP